LANIEGPFFLVLQDRLAMRDRKPLSVRLGSSAKGSFLIVTHPMASRAAWNIGMRQTAIIRAALWSRAF
jgi:hypothetical protein